MRICEYKSYFRRVLHAFVAFRRNRRFGFQNLDDKTTSFYKTTEKTVRENSVSRFWFCVFSEFKRFRYSADKRLKNRNRMSTSVIVIYTVKYLTRAPFCGFKYYILIIRIFCNSTETNKIIDMTMF